MGKLIQRIMQAVQNALQSIKLTFERVWDGTKFILKPVFKAISALGGGTPAAADPGVEAEAAIDRLIEKSAPKDEKQARDPEDMPIRRQAHALQMLASAKLNHREVPEEKLAKLPAVLRDLYARMTDEQAAEIKGMPTDRVGLWLRGEPGIGLPAPKDIINPPRPLFNRARWDAAQAAKEASELEQSNVVSFPRKAA